MAFGLSSAAIAEYAAKPFVARALANPRNPMSVLSFFLGVDYEAPTAPTELKDGDFLINDMTQMWFAGGPAYDELCQAFRPVLEDIGNDLLIKNHDNNNNAAEWDTSVDGKLAQIILCDQLSRNIFRGTDEAFAFDDIALHGARLLVDTEIFQPEPNKYLDGTFYPPYAALLVTALMHSEEPHDHKQSLQVLSWARRSTRTELDPWWDGQLAFELDHKRVIDRFGRYPHRNQKKGRESTKEELDWLANTDEVPGWALSQM